MLELLQEALAELERLEYIHRPQFEGKVGEPDLDLIARIRAALAS